MSTIVLKPMRTIVLMFGAIMRTNVLKCPQFFSSEFSISFNRRYVAMGERPLNYRQRSGDGTETGWPVPERRVWQTVVTH